MIVIDHVGSDSSLPRPVSRRLRSVLWVLMLMLSVAIYGSHAPLINLCKINGEIPFSSSSVVLLIELTKLMTSIVLLLIWDRQSPGLSLSWRLAAPFAISALLYGANNNLVVQMQHFMDPSTYQVLSNLKIGSTAMLYSVFLNHRLSIRKWLALSLLVVAGVCYTYGGIRDLQSPPLEMQLHITLPGLGMMFVYCLISGLSAVYTELILKTQQLSLNLQNLYLYSFGIMMNFLLHMVDGQRRGFFEGFSVWVAIVVASQALNGLIMSAVMKHSSNITRLFIISSSMLVNGLLSYLLFDLQLTNLFFLSVLAIGLSVQLFYGSK
ncbi:probable UDP-sugar transporter protein SLC35A4 [Ambystoma mexicanum]|uniref:probable UDP-sugar transporter protein SLC35A4 n=1 Tax=Ambystoma mexicanum TaxID=8296 RepID=UPI0037E8E974